MKAVVLAAGIGTRLKPLTDVVPKVMVHLVDRPLLQNLIEILKENGIKDIFLVVSYKKEMIQDYFKDGSKFGVTINYLFQDYYKGGTADALRYAKGRIEDEKFVVVYGDLVFEPKVLAEVLKKSKDFDGVLTAKEVEDPKRFGVFEVENGVVKKIHEKSVSPPSNLANAGIYVFPKEIFQAVDETKISPRGEYELTDSIQILINKGFKFGLVEIKGFWSDVGTIDELERAKEFVRMKMRKSS